MKITISRITLRYDPAEQIIDLSPKINTPGFDPGAGEEAAKNYDVHY
jgi:hypothetical protein